MKIFIDETPGDVRTVLSREMGFGQAIQDPVPFALHVPETALVEAISELYAEFVRDTEEDDRRGTLEREYRWMVRALSPDLSAQIRRDPYLAARVVQEWLMPETYWRLLDGPEDRADLSFVLNSSEHVERRSDGIWLLEGQGWRVVR